MGRAWRGAYDDREPSVLRKPEVLQAMHSIRLKMTAAALAAGLVLAGPVAAAGEKAPRVPPDAPLDRLHKLIAPGPNESQWMRVPWMPSSDIYAARKKAATEGKPLLLWYMAGEPLGTC
jgi:hypothetical protein